jgi:HlyD family secretion protein
VNQPNPLQKTSPEQEDRARNGPMSLSDRVRSLQLPSESKSGAGGSWLPWILCLVFAATTVYFAFQAMSAPAVDPEREKLELLKSKLAQAEAADASANSIIRFGVAAGIEPGKVLLESKGYVVPVQQIQVSPQVAGRVLKLNIEEGQRVKKGDILAELENVRYLASYRTAKGLADAAWQRWLKLASGHREKDITQSELAFKKSDAEFKNLKTIFDRSYKQYYNDGTLAKESFDRDKVNFESKQFETSMLKAAYELMVEGPRLEEIDEAWAMIQQTEADLFRAKWELDNCLVEAPITGMILTKKAEEGDNVNPAAFNISASLCEMADLWELEVDLAIAERDISKVFKGQKCTVRPEGFLGRSYAASVSRIMPVGDRAKGAVPVRVKIHIVPRLEEVTEPVVAAAVGLAFSPGAEVFHFSTAFITGLTEPQGTFLRPENGALVQFLNAKTE